MSRPGKILLGVVSTVVVLVVIAVVLVLTNLNRGIKYGIEHYGPSLTGTPVSLNKAKVSLLSGQGELDGLEIGNPKGFDSGYAFKLNEVKMSLDPESLTHETIVVNEILVDGASLNAEFKGTRSNLQQILDHLKQSAGSSAKEEQPTGGSEAGKGKKFIIKQFRFTNGDVTVLSDLAKVQQTARIPTVSVSGIGEKSGGATLAEVSEQLLRPVIKTALAKARSQALQQGAGQIKEKAKQQLEQKLKGLTQ